MTKAGAILSIFGLLLLCGCASKTSSQVANAVAPPAPQMQVVPYPKKADIPPPERPTYALTKADIAFLRWFIQFDAKARHLATQSLPPPKLSPKQAESVAQQWQQLRTQFQKREASAASHGVWAGYDLFLAENTSRYAAFSPSHLASPDPNRYTDEEWQLVLQNSKEGLNYCLDMIDLQFPGELPADIVAYRVR